MLNSEGGENRRLLGYTQKKRKTSKQARQEIPGGPAPGPALPRPAAQKTERSREGEEGRKTEENTSEGSEEAVSKAIGRGSV